MQMFCAKIEREVFYCIMLGTAFLNSSGRHIMCPAKFILLQEIVQWFTCLKIIHQRK